jgi:DNA-binding IclR family transcriptional regulator
MNTLVKQKRKTGGGKESAAPVSADRPPSRVDSKSSGPKSQGYTVEAVKRAMDILTAFSHAEPELALSQIVARTGLAKTTAFRILATLCDRGFCTHDPVTSRYSLGFEVLSLADIRRRQANVRDVAMPVMRQIRDQVNETIVLSVRTSDFRVHIDFVEGLHPMRRMADPGRQAPLYAGAASKVLLAGLDDTEIDDYLGRTRLKRLSKNTITSVPALRRNIGLIRRRGYAESKSELIGGGGALAAPVKDYSGATVAVIDILTPESRYTARHRKLCIELLLDGVRRVSDRLGYREGQIGG